MFVDFALDDAGAGDYLAVRRQNVVDHVDVQRFEAAVDPDLVDAAAARLGLGGDDDGLELRFRGEPRRALDLPDLVGAVELRGKRG